MAMASMDLFLAERKKTHGEAGFERRKKIGVDLCAKVEEWLRSEEGRELEGETALEDVIQFYRHRLYQIVLLLGPENLVKIMAIDPLVICLFIQRLILDGKMI